MCSYKRKLISYQNTNFITISVRVILALTRLHCLGALRGCQGQPLASPQHLLISTSGLQPFPPHRFVSVRGYCLPLLPYRPLPSTLLITHARLTYSLPYTLAMCLTIRLYLKKESSLGLDPYIRCPKTNFKYYKNIQTRI